MKKALSLILILVLCLSLCACGKSDAVKSVEAQIAELTTVTYADKDKVAAVRSAYSNLTVEERGDVENLSLLLQAESTIETEEKKLIDSIIADNDPDQAISQLRQFANSAHAQAYISQLGLQIVTNYVLQEGYVSDYRGDPDAEADYLAVAVNDCYFLVNPEYNSLQFVYSDHSPVDRSLESQYEVGLRDHRLYIHESGGTYSETDWIYEGWRYICYVNKDVSFNANSNFSALHPSVKCNDLLIWPYQETEQYLEENLTLNVRSYIDKMDICLRALDMPVTAWELYGIFE